MTNYWVTVVVIYIIKHFFSFRIQILSNQNVHGTFFFCFGSIGDECLESIFANTCPMLHDVQPIFWLPWAHVCLVGWSTLHAKGRTVGVLQVCLFWRSVISMWVLEDRRSDRSFASLPPKKVAKILSEFYWILMLWPSHLLKRCLNSKTLNP